MINMGNKTFFRSRYLYIIVFIILLITGAGCKYDNQILLPSIPCDTLIVTYSATVLPILNTHCRLCHSGPNANNGIRVDDYASVKQLVSNGKLLGTITHSPGFSPMPQGGKLSECNIAKIREWIARGALNN